MLSACENFAIGLYIITCHPSFQYLQNIPNFRHPSFYCFAELSKFSPSAIPIFCKTFRLFAIRHSNFLQNIPMFRHPVFQIHFSIIRPSDFLPFVIQLCISNHPASQCFIIRYLDERFRHPWRTQGRE